MSVSQTIVTCMMNSVALVASVALVVLLFPYKLTLVFKSSQHNFHSSSRFPRVLGRELAGIWC